MARRLIEEWLPIAALGIESTRERTPMTPFPAPNRLHVWWARRPLVASRAALLAALLPEDADRQRFQHMLGIHGDPVASRRRIELANRRGERLGADAYGYPRAFGYSPPEAVQAAARRFTDGRAPVVLDPTAGGGSIPFEALRLGAAVHANDLNPVAALVLKATVEYPTRFGPELVAKFRSLAADFLPRVRLALAGVYLDELEPDTKPDGYLWARTVTCPHCDGLIPLSPNWRLAPDGTGVRLAPQTAGGPGTARRVCRFEIVDHEALQSVATVQRGDVACPFPDCGRVIDDETVRQAARRGEIGEQLYAIVYKRRVTKPTKSGRMRESWERSFRAPRPEDDNSAEVRARLDERLPEWEALGILPTEQVESAHPKYDPRRWGMTHWRDFFSPRQLLGHGTAVDIYRRMVEEARAAGLLDEVAKAAFVYLGLRQASSARRMTTLTQL